MSQTLEVWDDQLVELGADIIRQRSQLIHDLAPHVQTAYESIAQEPPSMFVTGRRHPASTKSTRQMPYLRLFVKTCASDEKTSFDAGSPWSVHTETMSTWCSTVYQ